MPSEQEVISGFVTSLQWLLESELHNGRFIRPWSWPEMARSFCGCQDVASRLYYFTLEASMSITLVRSEKSRVIVQDMGGTKDALPSNLQPYLGEFSLSGQRAAAFIDKLIGLGAWTRSDCRTGARDGMIGVHVMASTSGDHCFRMHNPQCHGDTGYVQIVNLYSEEFLGGTISREPFDADLLQARVAAADAFYRDHS